MQSRDSSREGQFDSSVTRP
nr:unnamed protein product [Callosobruchus chinensis]